MAILKFKTRQIGDGRWIAYSGKKWYMNTYSDSEAGSRILRLQQIGQDAYTLLHEANSALDALGALDNQDPMGYCV